MSQEVWWNKKDKKHVEYKGRKNKLMPENEEFVKICKLPQKQLKNFLIGLLWEMGYDGVIVGDGYVYARGSIPFCLTAHMDTVHIDTVQTTYEFNSNGNWILSSSQGIGGDDRCGIYMIMNLIRKGYKPYIVFCEDEEIDCVGSKKFCRTEYIDEIGKECKYIIELDRANANDAVFYECDNDEFTDFIISTTKYEIALGSCSDISYLCPAAKIAGVNLSCGYYNAHTLGEYVNMTEMQRTQDVVEKLLNTECVQYEYIEKSYGMNYYRGYNWNYYGYGSNYYGREQSVLTEDNLYLEIVFRNEDGEEERAYEQGPENTCWANFFFTHPKTCYDDVIDWDYF